MGLGIGKGIGIDIGIRRGIGIGIGMGIEIGRGTGIGIGIGTVIGGIRIDIGYFLHTINFWNVDGNHLRYYPHTIASRRKHL